MSELEYNSLSRSIKFIKKYIKKDVQGDRGDRMDKFCWKLSSREMFDVHSYYKALHSSSHISFPWKTVWKPNVQQKLVSFCGERI